MSTAPKSNSTCCYFDARKLVESQGNVEIPVHLKDGNRDRDTLGHGVGYVYPHNNNENHVGQQYMPNGLLNKYFYHPSNQGYEKEIADRLRKWRSAQQAVLSAHNK